MEDPSLVEHSLPRNVLEPLLKSSGSGTLERSFEILIEASRSTAGRSDLASKNILPTVLELIQWISNSCSHAFLLSSLKLLRNLCAGEIGNQNSFIEQKGVRVVCIVMQSSGLESDLDRRIIQMALQVLANVSLAGVEHQRAIWQELFVDGFITLARIPYCEICDPLCMIVYSCCSGYPEMFVELCNDYGLPIIEEITRTASAVGFKKDWLKLILSKVCLEEPHFSSLFSKLYSADASEDGLETDSKEVTFSSEQAFLSRIMSEILNERIREINVPNDFVLCVFRTFKTSVAVIDSTPRGIHGLPTGNPAVDVLGYSLTIIRDICAQDRSDCSNEDIMGAIDLLLSCGLVELLLCLLRDLEPPSIIRKAIQESWCTSKPCPYKGFRRDVVAVIGNCAYRRKGVQDEVRRKGGILLLLQQCVADEENPFLREWGIWCMRNLLEGNEENQRVVTELELQGSVDVPEISTLGLRVEVDQKTRRPKLVNVSS